MDGSQVTKVWRLLIGALLLFGLCGCGSQKGPQPGPETVSRLAAEDDFGELVQLSKPPQRIICLAPNLMEIIFAIGLGDRVAGAVEFSDYPPEATTLPSVGRHDRPNLEKIISLNPDLVLMGFGNPRELAPALRRSGIPVFGANPKSIEDLLGAINRLGDLCGAEHQARDLTGQMQQRLAEIKKQWQARASARPKVFIVIDQNPFWTAGNATLQDEILRAAGGDNIAASRASYFAFSKEALLAAQPDYLLLPARPGEAEKLKQNLLSQKDLAGLEALRPENILVIDADSFSRPGPRVVAAVEQTYALLSPPDD